MVYRMKKAAVEMGNIIKEVSEHVPESFLWHNIFLPAFVAIMALHDGAAVQTVFFFTLWAVGQVVFFLKISTKKYKNPFFFVTEQLR
jgi:hypothetical protein